MTASIFSPDDKNFCQFMTPNLPKPRFWAQFHLGMGVTFFFFQKWHLALGRAQPGPGTCPSWTRDMPNLDQAWGSTWTSPRSQPGPGMGPNLDQAHAPIWTRHGTQPGPGRAQPGPGTGFNLDHPGPTWDTGGPNLTNGRPNLASEGPPGPWMGPPGLQMGPTWAPNVAHLGFRRAPCHVPRWAKPSKY